MVKKLLKPFGEWGIKLKLKDIIDSKKPKKKRIHLTSKEKGELFMEGCLTFILLLMLDIAALVIFQAIIIKNGIHYNQPPIPPRWMEANGGIIHSWHDIVVMILCLIDIVVLFWRLHRRYKQFQLQHIISELHYIAKGHYDHYIDFDLSGDLASIVKSINGLVSSTQSAIEEERRIKESQEELITNVSHDIRTPLTSVIGYLQLIETSSLTEEEYKQYVHIAYSKAKQMKTMVDDLFEYATMRHKDQLSISYFDLNQLVEQFEVDFALQIDHVKFVTDISPTPFYIEADADKLVRIFSNLISNAMKYGKNATEIQIIARKVNNRAKIIVRNNGEKIPKKALKRLFDRFYRLDSSRNQAIKGTGLGLAIVEGIVRLHHGYIYADSNESWTSFVIELPLVQKIKSE